MVKEIFIASLLATLSMPAFSSSLQSQLSAIAQAENEGKTEEQKQQVALQAKLEKEARAEKAKKQKEAATRAEKIRKHEAAQSVEKQRRLADAAADKKRDQTYEDELRKLELEMKKLELEKRVARVKRENDFIDQELKTQAAKTDVIQSEADVNRNLSSGGKALLESEGRAREKQSSGWFK
ncbi:DUF5384 family protein [Xenorhabdus hominickii]|uniref:Hydrocephalus-inducing protein Hy-3 n=1 Tax=Xenorhabdus hominickii TaxID=351679 RepID=A0A2G0QG93_XENHO|nr:DUF5384 family protein [Xenorhabdus hominickii]AOM42254.1 hypothetical protein A9255_17835 [Xenorhabdus hominickii]PHM58255.1 hypothetical protein Xhom_01269 [Xenorhabdus hominickii]